MAAALTIILRHQAEAGGALPLLEGWCESADGEHLWVQLPAWLVEIRADLARRYGEGGAEQRLAQVLRALLPFETYH